MQSVGKEAVSASTNWFHGSWNRKINILFSCHFRDGEYQISLSNFPLPCALFKRFYQIKYKVLEGTCLRYRAKVRKQKCYKSCKKVEVERGAERCFRDLHDHLNWQEPDTSWAQIGLVQYSNDSPLTRQQDRKNDTFKSAVTLGIPSYRKAIQTLAMWHRPSENTLRAYTDNTSANNWVFPALVQWRWQQAQQWVLCPHSTSLVPLVPKCLLIAWD